MKKWRYSAGNATPAIRPGKLRRKPAIGGSPVVLPPDMPGTGPNPHTPYRYGLPQILAGAGHAPDVRTGQGESPRQTYRPPSPPASGSAGS